MGIELGPDHITQMTMRTLNLLLAIAGSVLLSSCAAQMKNTRTVNLRIDGDCPLCAKRIAEAGNVKGEAQVNWDPDTKQATVAFDSMRTSLDAILKRISLAGYDTPNYLAPDAAYAALPGCCQYERTMKHHAEADKHEASTSMDEHATHAEERDMGPNGHDHSAMQHPKAAAASIQAVFDAYFKLKDALVASDAKAAKEHAEELNGALHSVDDKSIPENVSTVWPQVMSAAMPHLHPLSETTDLDKQRDLFAKLTPAMVQLAKAAPQEAALYLDHCPMYNGGSDWLSKEKEIKNPFYGSMMLGCGSVQESIQ